MANENPTFTAFKASPDRGTGLARDFRVRWAFEELGQPFDVQLVTFEEMKQSDYRELQPFGQIPAYREGDFELFESGAIVFYLAEKYHGLLPSEKKARALVIAWIFAALSTIEPPIVERSTCALFERDKSWYAERLPVLDDRVRVRLKDLTKYLGDKEWLHGAFSAADLLMVTVLRRLGSSGLLAEFPVISAYIARAEARPAYQRAFAGQLEVYEASLKK